MFALDSPKHPRILALLAMLLAAALALAPLSGCSAFAPTPEPVTIVFRHPGYAATYYQSLVEKFHEQYPYITVQLQTRSRQNNADASQADVLIVDIESLQELYQQSALFDLKPFIDLKFSAEELADFYPGALDVYAMEGKILALPSSADPMVMYYNKDLFDQYGAAYPKTNWTWSDFLQAASLIRDPEQKVYGYTSFAWSEFLAPLLFIYQNNGKIFDDLQNPTSLTFNDPQAIEALEWYASLYQSYNVAPTLPQRESDWGKGEDNVPTAIMGGKIGMWMGAFSERGGRSWGGAEWTMRWGMAPLPRGARSVTTGFVEGYGVAAQSPHPEAAWKWVLFLSEQIPQSSIPTRRSIVESPQFEESVGAEAASVARAVMAETVFINSGLLALEQPLQLYLDVIQAILTGEVSAAEAMAEAQSKLQP